MHMAKLHIVLLLLLGITSALNASILIQGALPRYPGKFVTVYTYDDLFSLSRKQIAQLKTDRAGHFKIDFGNIRNTWVNLQVENQELDIFLLENGAYTIFEEKGYLSVKDNKGFPVNKTLADIDDDLLHNWCPLFIDTTNGEFKRNAPEAPILQKLSAIEKKYSPADGSYPDQLLQFKVAFFKLWFLSSIIDVYSRLDQFREEYFNSPPYPAQNPFYAEALGFYMGMRINKVRAGASPDMVTRLLEAAAVFKIRRLQQLAIIAGFKQLYRGALEPGEMEKITNRIRNEAFVKAFEEEPRKILDDVIIRSNSLKIGDNFPVLPLKDRNGRTASIEGIGTDLILIDFWATSCFPCREAMTKFEDWLSQCNGKLTIVSISVDNDLATMNKYLDKRKPPLPSVALYNGKSGNYFTRMSIDGFPSYYILNRNKEIIAIPASTDSVLSRLKGLL